MIIDSSALLCLFFNEKNSAWVERQLMDHEGSLKMSTVNLTEVLILLKDRRPALFEQIAEALFESGIQFVPPSVAQTEIAARARLQYRSLNLGDCFAYALAVEENSPLLTLDRDFQKNRCNHFKAVKRFTKLTAGQNFKTGRGE